MARRSASGAKTLAIALSQGGFGLGAAARAVEQLGPCRVIVGIQGQSRFVGQCFQQFQPDAGSVGQTPRPRHGSTAGRPATARQILEPRVQTGDAREVGVLGALGAGVASGDGGLQGVRSGPSAHQRGIEPAQTFAEQLAVPQMSCPAGPASPDRPSALPGRVVGRASSA